VFIIHILWITTLIFSVVKATASDSWEAVKITEVFNGVIPVTMLKNICGIQSYKT